MSDNESDVFGTIMAFEQVLEVMPDDRGALESVAQAYDELGDQAQAKHYIMRLVRVLIDQGDLHEADSYIDKLRMYAGDDPEVVSLIEEFENGTVGASPVAASDAPDAGSEAQPPAVDDSEAAASAPVIDESPPPSAPAPSRLRRRRIRMSLNVADEMAFAWNLLQAERLTQDEYANVVQDLTDLAGGNEAGTVSVLHILQDRGFKGFEKMLAAVARETAVPVIDLRRFDIQLEAFKALPFRFIMHRGVLPFQRIGPDVLVACLNPYDESLRQDTESLAECRCHWYLTMPSSFDATVQAMKTRGEDEG